ncbi:MAG: hypothetical protein ACTSQF_11300 [Candidatus Heimdallarchaeaceae archaeon]
MSMQRFSKSLLLLLLLFPVIVNSNNVIETEASSILPETSQDSENLQLNYVPEQYGDQRQFWVWLGPDPVYIQMTATLLSVGNHCYVYMANDSIETLGQNESIDKCDYLKSIFDETIYPKAIELAGHPNGTLGDIDGDLHITIFLAPLVQMVGTAYLGYYLPQMENPAFSYSNNREMVFVDSDRDNYETVVTIIHELNHLIWGNYEQDEAHFLLEGLANCAVDYTGYSSIVTHWVTTAFLNHPEISLLYFNRNYGPLWDASYGQAYLFMTYLIEKFGIEVVKDLVSIPEDGAVAVQMALINNGYTIPFNQVFLNWITACVIDDTSFASGIYGFETLDYSIIAYTSVSSTFPVEMIDIPHIYYGFRVNRIYPSGNNYTFVIENPYPNSLGISIVVKDTNGWNVTQKLVNQDTTDLSFYISGDGLQEVYIITSLMSPTVPSEYGNILSLEEIIYEKLDFTIYEGFQDISGTDKSNFSSSMFVLVMFITCVTVLAKRRKK